MTITDEQFAELVSKMDTFSKQLESLTPKEQPDPADKIDTRDTSLAKGKAYFLTFLKDTLPKEKLDTLTFDELVLAAELKHSNLMTGFNPPPPITKTDTEKDDRPYYLIPTVEEAH